MSEPRAVTSNGDWGLAESTVFGAALVGFVATWALYVTAPPGGLVSPFGFVVSLLAGTYLAFLVFSYLR